MSQTPDKSSQLPQFHVVGFSGHRQITNPADAARVIQQALQALAEEVTGEWIALSSIASGGDQIFVEQVGGAGLAWHALLPLPRAEFASDFTPEEWVQVERTLSTAEKVRVIDETGSRDDAYLDCGMETVNGADVLIVVWDGQPARGKGGTAEVVEYALSLGKPLLIIDAEALTLRRENWHRLQFRDASLMSLNRLPMFQLSWASNPFDAPGEIFAFQQKCDYAASRGAPQFRRLTVSMLLLHILATIVAAAALAYALHLMILPWVKLLCLAGGVGFALLLKQRTHSQQNWVRCRLAAEFCRSAMAVWGLPRSTPLLQDLDVMSMRALTRTLQILHGRAAALRPVSIADFRRIYSEKRIDDQIAYFARQEARAAPLFARLKLWFWLTTSFALGCTALYAISISVNLVVPVWMQTTLFDFLPITLPVVAAALISMISINDLQRRVARYREMQIELEAGRRQLQFCETWNSVERVVLKIERALLHEVLEWHSTAVYAEPH